MKEHDNQRKQESRIAELAPQSETRQPAADRLKTGTAASDGENHAVRPAGRERVSGEPGQGVADSTAWKEAGHFATQHDEQGRVTRIEGWLKHTPGERSGADKKAQEAFRKEHHLTGEQDAFHLIGHEHGGPAGEHNLVAGDARINRSHHREFEKQLTADLAAGKEIYCRVDVQYADARSRQAERLDYSFFLKGKDGQPEPYTVGQYQVRLTERPEETTAQTLAAHEAKGFYSHDYRPKKETEIQ